MSDHEWTMTAYGPTCGCDECLDGPMDDEWISRIYERGPIASDTDRRQSRSKYGPAS